MCRDSTSFNIQGGTHLRGELVNVQELVYRTSLAAHQTGLQPEESMPLPKVSELSARLGGGSPGWISVDGESSAVVTTSGKAGENILVLCHVSSFLMDVLLVQAHNLATLLLRHFT